MPTRFRAHGDFHSRIEGRIVITRVAGPWNRELILEWASEMLSLCAPLAQSGPYVGIAVVSGSLLCPPDALDALRRAITYGTTQFNCIGNAVVAAADVEGRSMMQGTYETLYEDDSPHQFFHDLDSARAWALQLLAAKGYPPA